LAAIALAGVRISQIFARFEVLEHSMTPTLDPGDYIIVDRRIGGMRAGDLVVYAHPESPDFWFVKRVIGVAGDDIAIADGMLLRNGEPADARPASGDAAWSIGPGEVFVLGDNRLASAGDSLDLGPISVGLIEGVVAFRYWPADAIGRV
jgi:signal peptidase I